MYTWNEKMIYKKLPRFFGAIFGAGKGTRQASQPGQGVGPKCVPNSTQGGSIIDPIWAKTDPNWVEICSNFGQICSNLGHNLIQFWSKSAPILVKIRSKLARNLLQFWSDSFGPQIAPKLAREAKQVIFHWKLIHFRARSNFGMIYFLKESDQN